MLGVQSLGPIAPRRVSESIPVGAIAESASLPVGPQQALHHGSTRPCPKGASVPGATAVPRGTAVQNQESELERDAWVVLLSVSGLGPVSFGALLAAFGSARAALEAAAGPGGPARLRQALADAAVDPDAGSDSSMFDACAPVRAEASTARAAGVRRRAIIGDELSARICEAAANGAPALEKVRSLGLAVVTLEDPDYPDRLRGVELPPPLLFVRGSPAALSAAHSVAVVGTRRPTDKGRLIAGWIGSALARTGAVVVSGLAVGIDGAAHAAVVGEGGRTVAVLGGGHAHLFPKAHERLADAIVDAGGAIVSELTPETSPSPGTFPRRNRLVSGLSDATVVVEAGRRSGALITAGWALEQGRECFLVPGPLDAPASAGCLGFLRSFPGEARVVCGVAELIEDLQLDSMAGDPSESATPASADDPHTSRSAQLAAGLGAGRTAVLASLGPVERSLAEELVEGPATADQLAVRTGLPDAAVLSALTLLELRGLVAGAYGRYTPRGDLATWSGSSSTALRGRGR